ncbi:MAG: PilN domain-containing protein [Actinobacteria bacterium]|nr:PilN domain-containing protein [Actinomycetota bacterium]
MRAVNLLPRDHQRERLQGARIPLLAAAGGVVAVTAFAMFLVSSAAGEANERRTELKAVEAAIRALPKVQNQAVTQGSLVRERSDRVAALAAALTTRVPFDRVLREISFVLPEDTWLTQLTATAPVSIVPVAPGAAPPSPTTASATPAGVTIEGATYSHDSVARFLARLSTVPSLENVRLTSSARVEPQTETPNGDGAAEPTKPRTPFVTFIVSASLRTGATR